MKAEPGKLVWVEHASADPAKARTFYAGLFGWDDSPMEVAGSTYHVIMNAGEGIGGFRPAQQDEPTQWGIYLSVADVDASHEKAIGTGAATCMPPTDFPPVGRGATMIDPVGAMFSIWRSTMDDKPDAEVPPGHWCWHELHASHPEKALSFYEALFGLKHDAMPSPGGTYYVLKQGEGNRRGGLMKSAQDGTSSKWLPYVHVTDVDAAAGKAKKLGAEVRVPPTDIPHVGRFAVLSDPQGASFAVFLPMRQ